MLGGIFTRWKQIVAFYYTPDGFNGACLKSIIEQIIEKAEFIGLYVHSVTSDMGSVNQAMWRAFSNISAGRYSKIVNSVPHPNDNTRKLFFFADAPHLIKNLRSSLINNKVIMLPDQFKNSNQLSSNIVQFIHLEELVNEQENLILKLAPKLNREILTPTNFNKMKVNKATSMLNRDVSSALNFLGNEEKEDNYKTTALFIEIISKWFTVVTSRTPLVALGKKAGDEKSEKKFNETIEFLQSVIDLFRNMEIGKDKRFKPVQTGVMITTQSLIELTQYFINDREYLYVLGGRFTQDCVENLFSNIRHKFPIPNALQFKQSLKILSVS